MKFLKIGGVIVGALIITALGIDAADTLQGKSGTMLSQVIQTADGVCPPGMTELAGGTFSCIDTFEVSAKGECPHKEPKNILQSKENLDNGACGVESREGTLAWTFVTREQALQMCARAGKRLPTAVEWYTASLGYVSADTACNVGSGTQEVSGARSDCKSTAGVYDMVGNVWEWVSDDVIDGVYNNRKLPADGFVTQVDNGGIATLSGGSPDVIFDSDYFWAEESGAYGMIRGGFYGSGQDAGVYSVHADTPANTAGTAIGFRCIK